MNVTETLTKWSIDPSHSEIQFKVKHLVISTVSGTFGNFSGVVECAPDTFENARIAFTADTASISTNSEQRDNHLKSTDFFDAENFPQIRFESDSLSKIDDENYKLEGKLTIKGKTHPVTLAVEFGGAATDPYGNEKAGFEINGKINRKDFGLTWSAVTEAGGAVVGDDVKLHMNVQLVKS